MEGFSNADNQIELNSYGIKVEEKERTINEYKVKDLAKETVMIENVILDILRRLEVNEIEISKSTRMEEIEFDSILWIRFIVELETLFQFRFSDSMLSAKAFTDIASLIKYVEESILNK